MNERIKELAEQVFGSTIDTDPILVYEAEKFAELIIRECAQYVEAKFDFCGDELLIAEKLKEHFGVKE